MQHLNSCDRADIFPGLLKNNNAGRAHKYRIENQKLQLVIPGIGFKWADGVTFYWGPSF